MSLTRTRKTRRSDDADVDMTPMLDIVFIMLIFFIVTATFLDETALDFTQPFPAETPITSLPAISVYVDAKNIVTVDNEVAELSSVASRVERLMADKPNAVISLRADAQASLDPVVYIKNQMALAGRETVMKIDRPN